MTIQNSEAQNTAPDTAEGLILLMSQLLISAQSSGPRNKLPLLCRQGKVQDAVSSNLLLHNLHREDKVLALLSSHHSLPATMILHGQPPQALVQCLSSVPSAKPRGGVMSQPPCVAAMAELSWIPWVNHQSL